VVERFLKTVVGVVSGLLRFLWEKVCTEPVRSRGVEWTLWLWAHAVACLYFGLIIAESHRPIFLALILYYLSAWRMYKTARPKSLGRKLRYRRQR